MKRFLSYVLSTTIFLTVTVLVQTRSAVLAACSTNPDGDVTISESCSFSGAVEGADGGNLVVASGSTLTVGTAIDPNQTVVWGPGKSITIQSNASIVLTDGSKLVQSNIYVPSSGIGGYADPIGLPGAVAVYRMEDNAGTSVTDSKGSYNATSTGTTSVTGKIGLGRSFNGSGDKIQASSAILTGTGDFTVSAWIYRTSVNTTDYIAGNYGTGNTGGIEFAGNADGKIGVYIGSWVQSTNTVSANTWYHAAVTRASGAVKLYINGSQDGSGGTLSGSITGTNSWTIGNGADYTTEAFGGTLDEVQVFARALSATEVFGLAHPAQTGMAYVVGSANPDSTNYRQRKDITPGLKPVAWWRLDESSGNGAYYAESVNTSASGSGADGALSVTGTTTINTTQTGLSSSSNAGQAVVNVSSTTGFTVGDEVLIIQMAGSGIGNNEIRTIASIGAGTLTMTLALTNTYTTSAQAIKVPQYTTVTVNSAGTLTASAWNGTIGGVLVFKATGAVTVNSGGTITMAGKGLSSGAGWPYNGCCTCSAGGTGSAGTSGGGAAGGAGGGGGQSNCAAASSGAGGGSASSYTFPLLTMGSGGGGGGGGAAPDANSGRSHGGNGGAGGGIIFATAESFTVTGSVSVNGAAGERGGLDGCSSPCNNGAGGGGGGGGGGSVRLDTTGTGVSGDANVTVAGGSYGAGETNATYPGSNGASGSAGSKMTMNLTPVNGSSVLGKFGNGRSLDGSSAYLTTSSSTSYTPALGTVSLWVKPSSQPSTNTVMNLISTVPSGQASGWKLDYQDSAGTKQLRFRKWTPEVAVTANTTLSTTAWSHVVATWNGTTTSLYVNGASVGSGSQASPTAASLSVYIGRDSQSAGEYFAGLLDDVRIYNLALSLAKVNELYLAGYVTGCSANSALSAPTACTSACHTDTQYAADGMCGQTTCPPGNYPAAGSCSCPGNYWYYSGSSCTQDSWCAAMSYWYVCPSDCHSTCGCGDCLGQTTTATTCSHARGNTCSLSATYSCTYSGCW